MLKLEEKDKNYRPSSIKFALDHLNREIASYIARNIDSILLEGEIIAINKNKMISKMNHNEDIYEEVLVNVGTANGVYIGDLFEVHAIGLGLHDPFSGNDLGDIYVRTGVIQIVHAWDGFSKAISLGGKNFKTGYLIRSTSALGENKFLPGAKNSTRFGEEKALWWEFHGIRAVN